jgi:predicted Zn-dependent protease
VNLWPDTCFPCIPLKTKRGILVRRLWYIRFVDQKTLVLTGMTRDGVFMIRDGRPEGYPFGL